MKVNRANLLDAIGAVRPGVSKKGVIEQATHVIFSNNEVVTFNDQVCVMAPFEMEFPFSVKEDEFSKILNSTTEEEVDITQTNGAISIKAKGLKAELSTILGEESKVEHLIEAMKASISAPNAFKPLPKEFIDGVYLCSFSANKDVATGVRSCVAIKDDSIYSTDGIRVSMYIMDAAMDQMLIPARDAAVLVKYQIVEYAISENWLHFRTKDGIVFNCKTMKGDYPFDRAAALIADIESELILPSDLTTAVNSVIALAEGDQDVNKTVRLSISKNIITIKAEKERGWIEKTIPFEYTGDAFNFLINPIFFSQVLNHATGFVLIDGKAQFASENFYHVLALPTED